ncbi:MAG: arsenate reductase [Vicingaceae bacterium]|jgi:arsenate reductase
MTTKSGIFIEIENTLSTIDITTIPNERKKTLQPFVDYLQFKVSNHQEIRLNFICTHNSRRSHLSQIWAQTLAFYFNVKDVFCYSGGTEATALFPTVAKTLKDQGFKIQTISESNNPVYTIKYAVNEHPVIGFSKNYEDNFNPQTDFAAIMTCSQADIGCPVIFGASKRFSIPFADPKVFDNTAEQAKKYREKSLQIATDLYYIFSQLNS